MCQSKIYPFKRRGSCPDTACGRQFLTRHGIRTPCRESPTMTEHTFGLQYDLPGADISEEWRTIVPEQARTLEALLHQVHQAGAGVGQRTDYPQDNAEGLQAVAAQAAACCAARPATSPRPPPSRLHPPKCPLGKEIHGCAAQCSLDRVLLLLFLPLVRTAGGLLSLPVLAPACSVVPLSRKLSHSSALPRRRYAPRTGGRSAAPSVTSCGRESLPSPPDWHRSSRGTTRRYGAGHESENP